MLYRNDFKVFLDSSDYDNEVSFKEIDLSGVSEYSKQRLRKLVEKYNYVSLPYCGHSHDCCGCVSSYSVELFLSGNSAILKRTIRLNY